MYKTTDIIECKQCWKNLSNCSLTWMFYCRNSDCEEYGRYLTSNELEYDRNRKRNDSHYIL